MLLTFAREDGEDRLYATRFHSVVCYFTADDSGDGVILNVEPGFIAIPSLFERVADEVQACVLAEVSLRIGVSGPEIFKMSMSQLREYADPALAAKYRYASRSRSRAAPNRM